MSKKAATKQSQPEAMQLSEYVSSLFQPLNSMIAHTDRICTEDEFHPATHQSALHHQAEAIKKKFGQLGEALDEALDCNVYFDATGLNYTFLPVTSVNIHGGHDYVGGIFGDDRFKILTTAMDLIPEYAEDEDVDWQAWEGMAHILHLSVKALKQHFLSCCQKITDFLGEVTVSVKGRKKDLSITAERAEAIFKKMHERREAYKKQEAEYVIPTMDELAAQIRGAEDVRPYLLKVFPDLEEREVAVEYEYSTLGPEYTTKCRPEDSIPDQHGFYHDYHIMMPSMGRGVFRSSVSWVDAVHKALVALKPESMRRPPEPTADEQPEAA